MIVWSGNRLDCPYREEQEEEEMGRAGKETTVVYVSLCCYDFGWSIREPRGKLPSGYQAPNLRFEPGTLRDAQSFLVGSEVSLKPMGCSLI
jgi:hypothetical protein